MISCNIIRGVENLIFCVSFNLYYYIYKTTNCKKIKNVVILFYKINNYAIIFYNLLL